MCATCAVTEAARASDWDEVARLAREQKKTEKAGNQPGHPPNPGGTTS
jgi:hypothetical protein